MILSTRGRGGLRRRSLLLLSVLALALAGGCASGGVANAAFLPPEPVAWNCNPPPLPPGVPDGTNLPYLYWIGQGATNDVADPNNWTSDPYNTTEKAYWTAPSSSNVLCGGNFTVSAPLTVTGVSGSSITQNATLTITGADLSDAGVNDTGAALNLPAGAALRLAGGDGSGGSGSTFTAGATVNVSGKDNLGTPAAYLIIGANTGFSNASQLNNSGITEWPGSNICVDSTSEVFNATGALLYSDIQGGAVWGLQPYGGGCMDPPSATTPPSGTGKFVNMGEFDTEFTGVWINVPFDNNGLVEAGAPLHIQNGSASAPGDTGKYMTQDDLPSPGPNVGAIYFATLGGGARTFASSATFSGAGTFYLSNGTFAFPSGTGATASSVPHIELDSAAIVSGDLGSGDFILAGGTLQGAQLLLTGTSSLAGCCYGNSQIDGGTTVLNQGTLAYEGGVCLSDTSQIVNATGATINVDGATGLSGAGDAPGLCTEPTGVTAADGTLLNDGTLNIPATGSLHLGIPSDNVSGSRVQVGGSMEVSGPDLTGDADAGHYTAQGADGTPGTILFDSPTREFAPDAVLDGAGTFTLGASGAGGTYSFDPPTTQGASPISATNLTLSGGSTLTGQLTTTGSFDLAGGTLDAADLTVTGTGSLSGCCYGTQGNIAHGSLLDNQGSLTYNAGVCVSDTSQLVNEKGSAMTVGASGGLDGAGENPGACPEPAGVTQPGDGTFFNDGTMNVPTGMGLRISIPYDNGSSALVQVGGSLEVASGDASDATTMYADGGHYHSQGPDGTPGSITFDSPAREFLPTTVMDGTGTFNMGVANAAGGTYTFDRPLSPAGAPITVTNLSNNAGSTVKGALTVQDLHWNGGVFDAATVGVTGTAYTSDGTGYLDDGSTLTNSGDFAYTGGIFCVSDSSQFVNAASGHFYAIIGNAAWGIAGNGDSPGVCAEPAGSTGSGDGSFINNGQMSLVGGGITIGVPFDNAGDILVDDGASIAGGNATSGGDSGSYETPGNETVYYPSGNQPFGVTFGAPADTPPQLTFQATSRTFAAGATVTGSTSGPVVFASGDYASPSSQGAQLSGVTLNSGATLEGTIHAKDLLWAGGTFANGVVTLDGTSHINVASVQDATVTNIGTLDWDAGDIALCGAQLINQAAMVVNTAVGSSPANQTIAACAPTVSGTPLAVAFKQEAPGGAGAAPTLDFKTTDTLAVPTLIDSGKMTMESDVDFTGASFSLGSGGTLETLISSSGATKLVGLADGGGTGGDGSFAGALGTASGSIVPPKGTSYQVAACGAGCAGNPSAPLGYGVTMGPGDVTITFGGFPVAVQGPSPTIAHGSSIPPLTPAYSGLQGGDTAPATPATCTTTATSASPPGTYPVTCSGAADPKYTFTYRAGALTISPSTPKLSGLSPSSGLQGTSSLNLTLIGSDFENGAKVTFANTGITVNSTSFVSSSTLTANISIAAGAPAGATDVSVANPDGGRVTDVGGFSVGATPAQTGTPSASSGRPKVKGSKASITVTCSAACTVNVTLAAVETLKGNKIVAIAASKRHLTKRTVVLGSATAAIGAGGSKVVTVSLNRRGRALLAKHHTLKVGLAISVRSGGKRLTLPGRTVSFSAATTRR